MSMVVVFNQPCAVSLHLQHGNFVGGYCICCIVLRDCYFVSLGHLSLISWFRKKKLGNVFQSVGRENKVKVCQYWEVG